MSALGHKQTLRGAAKFQLFDHLVGKVFDFSRLQTRHLRIPIWGSVIVCFSLQLSNQLPTMMNRAYSLRVRQDSFKASETLFGQDSKNSNELLVTRSENSFSDGNRHLLAELNFLLFDVDSTDDGPSAQCFIKREHETNLKRCATAVTRRSRAGVQRGTSGTALELLLTGSGKLISAA
jgi:hypothetical protein